MKKNIKTLINIIGITIVLFCTYMVLDIQNEYKQAEVSTEKVKSIKSSSKSSKDTSLYNANNDFKFWIDIDNTNIDYPVVQGKDNDFYLTHDFFKEESIAGSVFLDYRINNKSKNLIVYGHNMKDNTMFSDLELFKDKEFFNKNNLITISKGDKEYIYEVFSVYYISGEKTSHLQTNFNSNNDFFNYLEIVQSKSLFKSKKELTSNEILTLSTCSYEFKNYRTVVHAQLIEVK